LWIPFRALSFADAMTIYASFVTYADPAVLVEIFYSNTVLCTVFLIAAGLIMLPFEWKNKCRDLYYQTPVVLKFIALAFAIQLAIQITDAEVQPFIYFQF
jgi:hypothetical protein